MISSRDFLDGKLAAVFDFDGTLADTIGLWNEVDVCLAAELGVPNADPVQLHVFREEALRRYKTEENPYRCYCGDFGQKFGSTMSAEQIHARRFQISRRILKEDVRLRPGAASVLRCLRQRGFRLAVATTTRRANIEIYCNDNERIRKEIHLADVFEGFVCAEDVANIKPDPECYRKALALLRIEPQQGFAVEDTLAGVEAARAAGLECIGIREPHSERDAEKIKTLTVCYFDTHEALLNWLK